MQIHDSKMNRRIYFMLSMDHETNTAAVVCLRIMYKDADVCKWIDFR